MTEHQIPFSAPMVRAVVGHYKRQTRRVVRGQALDWLNSANFAPAYVALPSNGFSPYGYAGDHLWVREAWRTTSDDGRYDDMPPRDLQPHRVWYEADGKAPANECVGKYRPSMFMPRWASRITLVVTGVRIERLQSITDDDAVAEGILPPGMEVVIGTPRDGFRNLWDSLNAARGYGWDTNPWVWVVEFNRVGGTSE